MYRHHKSLMAILLAAVMIVQTGMPAYAAAPGETVEMSVVESATDSGTGNDEINNGSSDIGDMTSGIDTDAGDDELTDDDELTGDDELTDDEALDIDEDALDDEFEEDDLLDDEFEEDDLLDDFEADEDADALGGIRASGTCGATGSETGVTWELDDDGTLTISGSGAMKDYITGSSGSRTSDIPWDSYHNAIKKVVIGDGVSHIGAFAFGYNDNANYYSKLVELELPDSGSLQSIGEKAFRYASNLKECVIPQTVNRIDRYAFNRSGIESLVFEGTGDVTLGGDAFSMCQSMTSASLRSGMTSICDCMFEGSRITMLVLPASITNIYSTAFNSCYQLEAVYIEPDPTNQSTYYSDSFGKVYKRTTAGSPGGTVFYTPPKYAGFPSNITTITAETLASKKDVLTSVEIPATVTTIEEDAFEGFSKLATVTFASGSALTSIGVDAFKDCEALVDITLPEGLTTIGATAFSGCSSLVDITLPASLTSFAEDTFEGCGLLEAVTISDGNPVYFNGIGDNAGIVYLTDGGSIYFIPPACETELQPNTLSRKWVTNHVTGSQTSFPVQAHVTNIATGAFEGYDNLTSISFEDGSLLKTVSADAFKDCTGLTTISLPTTLTTLNETAFAGCTNLATINIGAGGKANGGSVYYSESGVVYLTDGDYVWYQPEASAVTGLWPVHLTAEWVAEKYPTPASVTSITIPKYVRSVGDEAFSGYSSLATVTLAEDSILESIGSKAFYGCTSLESISLPATLRSFDAGTSTASFKNCTNLAEINIAEGNTKYSSDQGIVFLLSNGTIYYQPEGNHVLIWPDEPDQSWINTNLPKNSTEEVTIPANVTKLPSSAFNGYSKLKTVTFKTGSALTSVGNYAFAYCSKLETIVLPVGVKTVGENAFNGCSSLATWPLSGNTALTTIGNRAFQGCSSLTTAGIPATVTSIGVAEFDGCASLTEFTFASAASTFGVKLNNSMFEGCSNLTSLAIPTGIKQIGNSTFKNCSKLATVTGLDFADMTQIGAEAFSGCLVLELGNVSLPKITTMTDRNFMDCRKLTGITLGAITDLDGKVFMGCSGLETVTFPLGDNAKLTRLGIYSDSNVFNGCSSLTTITLPKTLSNFPQHTFDGCNSLETIFIEDGNTKYYSTDEGLVKLKSDDSVYIKPPAYGGEFEIPADATTIIPDYYKGNTKMKNVTIPARITSIEPNAFEGCTSLTSVTFETGSKCTNIGKEAFKGCTSLTTIPFPTALTTIGEGAFRGCTSLETITVPATVTSLGSSAYRECTALESITVPASVEEIPSNLCNGCTALTDITIASGITRINENAFNGCTGLISVNIPGSVEYVNGFNNCSSLTSITFGEGVLTINGFTDCDSLVTLTIPASCTTLFKPGLLTCDNLANVYIAAGSQTYVNRAELPGIVFTTDGNLYLIPPASTVDNIWPVPVTNEWMKAHFPTGTTTELTIPAYVISFNANAGDNWLSGYDHLEKIIFSEDSLCETTPVFTAATALEEVVLPSSVTKIESLAFKDMASLEKVSFTASPETLIIGNQSFAGCTNLSDFAIPATTTQVWYHAFTGCDELAIDATTLSNVTLFGKECFDGSLNLTGKLTVAAGAQILSNAFSGTGITEAVIPANVTYGSTSGSTADYGYHIFSGSKLRTVTINGTKVPGTCFSGCTDLTTANMTNVTEVGGSAFYGCTKLSSISTLKKVTDIDVCAFQGCTGLTGAIDLPKLKTLGYNAFSDCTGITSAVIPATVTSLGEEVFSGCSNLTTLALNASTAIPNAIVKDCPKLKTVTISNATKISNDAFTSAVFESITIPATVTEIGRRAFKDCDMLSAITIPKSVEEIDENAFSGCDRLASVTFTKGDKSLRIKDYAFAGCVSLTSITLPSNVSGCGSQCFENCRSLRSFSMDGTPANGIGFGAFMNCTSLESVKLPNITKLDEYVFSGCTSLGSITLPLSLTYIGSHAFEDTHISEIEIPASVDTIKEDAFAGCGDLQEFKVKSGNAAFKAGTGNGDKKGWLYKKTNSNWVLFLIPPGWAGEGEDAEFRIPEEMTEVKWDAFAGNKSIRHLVIPATVTMIRGSAFKDCENLETVTVESGSNLVYIGVLAFAGCTNLRTVEFEGASVLSGIEQEAFKDCNSLQSIRFANNSKDIELGYDSFAGAYMLTGIHNGHDDAKLGDIGYQALGDTAIESLTLGASCRNIYEYGLPTTLKRITIADGNTVYRTEDAGTKLYEGTGLIWSLNNSIYTVPAGATSYAQLFETIKCDNDNDYTEIAIADGNTAFAVYDGALYSADGKTLYCVPTAWNGGVFTVRPGTETIGDFAFLYCSGISRVTLPNGVKTIGYGAFAGIEGYPNMIRRIDIPASVDTVLTTKSFETSYTLTAYTPFDFNTTDSDFDDEGFLLAALKIYGPSGSFIEGWLKDHPSMNLYWDFDENDYASGGSGNQYISSSGQAFYITYDLPDDAANDPDNPAVYRRGTVELKPATRPGYRFGGWFTDSSCADEYRIETLTPDNAWSYTLYARWDLYTGWKKDNNGVWKYYEDGEIQSSKFVTVGNDTYYLDENGERTTGQTTIAGETYYFNRKGVAQTGWISDGSGKHYYDPEQGGAMAAETWIGDGKGRVYVDEHGDRMSAGPATITETVTVDDGNGNVTEEQVEHEYYFDNNGQVRTGWIKITTQETVIDPNTGEPMVDDEGHEVTERKDRWYYYNPSEENYGARITAEHKTEDPDGESATRIIIGGKTYLIDESGERQTGWTDSDGDGKDDQYYDTNGTLTTGWKKIDGDWYYFWPDDTKDDTDPAAGGHEKGEMATGLTVIDGKLYALDDDGKRAGGGESVDVETGSGSGGSGSGDTVSGTTNRNGVVKLDEQGFIKTSDGSEVYVGENGKVVTDTWVQTDDGNGGTKEVRIGSDGKVATGLIEADGKIYVLDEHGTVTTDSDEYFYNADGSIRTGWVNDGANTYYYDENGRRIKNDTHKVGRKVYAFDENGGLLSSGMYSKIPAEGEDASVDSAADAKYIVNDDGTLYTGWNGDYYFSATTGEKCTKLNKVGTKWYYFNETTGARTTGPAWAEDGKFYIDADGIVQTGWQTIDGAKYYLGKDGRCMKDAVIKAGVKLYYQTSAGIITSANASSDAISAATGGVTVIASETGVSLISIGTGTDRVIMPVSDGGALKTGWQTIGGSKYYFSPMTGNAYTFGRYSIGGRWYDFDAAGTLQ